MSSVVKDAKGEVVFSCMQRGGLSFPETEQSFAYEYSIPTFVTVVYNTSLDNGIVQIWLDEYYARTDETERWHRRVSMGLVDNYCIRITNDKGINGILSLNGNMFHLHRWRPSSGTSSAGSLLLSSNKVKHVTPQDRDASLAK